MPLGDTPTIDGLILDYLLHHCISALLLEWGVQHNQHEEENSPHVPLNETSCAQVKQEVAKKADRSLLLVNSFLQTYQQFHPSGVCSLTRDVRFRLILCRFIAIFLRRIDPASSFAREPQTTVLRCREQRHIRLQRYLKRRGVNHVFPNDNIFEQFLPSSSGQYALSSSHLARYYVQRFGPEPDGGERVTAMRHITRNSTMFPGSICGTATLSDALPLFMTLSAWTSAVLLGSPVSTLWMAIASSFMGHAFAEDYLCHGVPALEAFSENFAWGVVPFGADEKETNDTIEDIVVNEMFGADEGGVSKEWERIRSKVLMEIVPPGRGTGLENHLVGTVLVKGEESDEDGEGERLVGSFDTFEKDLVEGLLMAIVRAVGEPVLAQLEQGQLEGLGPEEVEALLFKAGVSRGD